MNIKNPIWEDDLDLPTFVRIKTRTIRASRECGIRVSRESSCGQKSRMPAHYARNIADKIIGRAYKCPFCRQWHVTSYAAPRAYPSG